VSPPVQLDVLVDRIPRPEPARARLPDLDAGEGIDVLVWERVDDDGINNAEHRSRGGDAERDGCDGHHGRTTVSRQGAKTHPHVETGLVEKRECHGRASDGVGLIIGSRIFLRP
jgi:hypothetical protein